MKMEMCLNNLMAYRNQPQTEGIQSKCPTGRMVPCYLIPVLLCLCSIHNKNCIPVTCPLILTNSMTTSGILIVFEYWKVSLPGQCGLETHLYSETSWAFPTQAVCWCLTEARTTNRQPAGVCCVRLTETWILSFGTLQYQSKCCQCGSHLQFLSPI